MHLEEFIETLERGLGDGFGWRLNLPEWKVEFFIDEDPTHSVFEVTVEVVGNMSPKDVPDIIEKLFADTLTRLRARAAKLKADAGDVTRRASEVFDDINRTLREREDDGDEREEEENRGLGL